MRRSFPVFIIGVVILLQTTSVAQAESSYVLPYPSNMPGSKWYALDQLQEKLSKYWYIGDFGSFSYNLYYADKYLVEAKTLFEYNQYLLAVAALEESDVYFQRLDGNLFSAKEHGKNISEKKQLLLNAAAKHGKEIDQLLKTTPSTFIWSPEKESSIQLDIHQKLKTSKEVRM